ncbi:MAG: hypothetical protein HY361_02305 [Candidatus Aenigmarchaeota archaeon]|nr:hypothetical protein [Candidatus Aenigmarchaeota archaeon]
MRIIAGIVVAVALASVNLLPSTISSQISNYISPFTTTLTSFTKSLGLQGTLIASGVLIFVGVILGKISGKSLFKKTVKKAGEPTSKNEKVLEQLEKKRDHMIAQLKNAKGDPVSELQIEKAINQINEKINILKAKLGLPITA